MTLWLNGKVYSFVTLKDEDPNDFDHWGREVVTFFKQWFEGREQFEARTSGATGEPKPITLERSKMIASALLTQEALGLNNEMTALLCLDPTLIAGKMMMVRCLVTGMNLVATNPTANPLDQLPQGIHIHFAAMVPLQATTIITSGKYPDFASIDKVILGGGAVSLELEERLRDLSTLFYATFGMTETLSHVALQKLNGPDRTDHFEGLPGVQFTVDDRGCLIIQASHLGSQPVITNDLVKLLGPTKFLWLGRWDNLINTGGVKVIPEEIEKEIAVHYASLGIGNRFFITSLPHGELGQEVVMIVEGALSPDIETKLLNTLKSSLEKYKAPKRVLYAVRFELTTLGKIKRKETLATASPRPGQ